MLSTISWQNRIFLNYFKIELRRFYEYPLNFFAGFFWWIGFLIPMYFVWASVAGNGNIAGYSFATIMLYTAFSLGLFVHGGFLYDFRRTIISGEITQVLVKSIRVEGFLIYNIIAKILKIQIIQIFSLIAIGVYFTGVSSLFGFLFYFLGLILVAMTYSILITTSFWLGENWGMFFVGSEIILITSGGLLPLDLFPVAIQNIFNVLPFKLMYFVPAKVYLGQMQITYLLILQYIIWGVILYLVLYILVKRGLKRFEQLGG